MIVMKLRNLAGWVQRWVFIRGWAIEDPTGWQSTTRCQPLTHLTTILNCIIDRDNWCEYYKSFVNAQFVIYCNQGLSYFQNTKYCQFVAKKRCKPPEIDSSVLYHCKMTFYSLCSIKAHRVLHEFVKVSVVDPIPHIITGPPAHPSPFLSGPSSWSSCSPSYHPSLTLVSSLLQLLGVSSIVFTWDLPNYLDILQDQALIWELSGPFREAGHICPPCVKIVPKKG